MSEDRPWEDYAAPAAGAEDAPWLEYASPTVEVEPPEAAPAPPSTVLPARERFKLGVSEPYNAAQQLMSRYMPQPALDFMNRARGLVGTQPLTQEGIDQRIKEQAAKAEAGAPEGIDWARLGGNMLGAAPLAAIAPGGPVIGGILSGAAGGALTPVTEPEKGFGEEKLWQAGTGGIMGGALGAVVSPIARFMAPRITPNARALMAEGIRPTTGQMFGGYPASAESQVSSVPVLGDMINVARRRGIGDMNVAAYNRALAPIGERSTQAAGHEGVAEVRRKLSGAYDDLLPNLTWRADPQFVGELQNLTGMAHSLPDPQARQFDRIMRNKVLHRINRGQMDGQTLKGVEEELGDLAKGYLRDPSFDQRQLGTSLGEVLASIRGTTIRSNPDYGPRLQAINEGWANYARIRKAASGKTAHEGIASPAQLHGAVRDATTETQFSEGRGLMQDLSGTAKDVLGSNYPDSGTAGRAMLGAAVLGGAGSFVSPWAIPAVGTLAASYTRPGQAFMRGILAHRPPGAGAARRAMMRGSPFGSLALGDLVNE